MTNEYIESQHIDVEEVTTVAEAPAEEEQPSANREGRSPKPPRAEKDIPRAPVES